MRHLGAKGQVKVKVKENTKEKTVSRISLL